MKETTAGKRGMTGKHSNHPTGRRVPPVRIACETCGAIREYAPSEVRQRGQIRFCSNACKGKGQRQEDKRIEVPCANCGVQVEKLLSRIKLRTRPCCSKECAAALRRVPAARWRDPNQIKAYMQTYREEHRVQLNAAMQVRKKKNRPRENVKQRARRAITGVAPLKNPVWNVLKATYDHRCLACGRQEPEIKLEKDHVIPVTAGGTNDVSNFQPLCHPCNASKGNKVIDYRLDEMLACHGVRIKET